MANPIVRGFQRRGRRCALMPDGINLAPEEEILIMNRIGYHPIPPPDAVALRRAITRMSEERKSDTRNTKQTYGSLNSSAGAGSAPNGGEYHGVIGFKKEIAWEGSRFLIRAADNKDQKPVTDTHNFIPELGEGGIKHETRCQAPTMQPRRASWSVDIPHMSEIPPLNNRSSMEAMRFSWQGGYDSAYPETSAASGGCGCRG